jgi:hypothetical protein
VDKRIQVSPRALLNFFDVAPPESRKHATALVAMAGEELGLALLAEHLRRQGQQAGVLYDQAGILERCTPGTKAGSRLDGWIDATDAEGTLLYQVEVKNWSAHAIGGVPLAIDASENILADHRQQNWSSVWDGRRFTDDAMRKVLLPMKPPYAYKDRRVEPVICFWYVMHSQIASDPLFSVEVEPCSFKRVWVFSMSSFLRSIVNETLTLEMPQTRRRMQWLSDLFLPVT